MSDDIEIYQRALEREKLARKKAEALLEEKSLELYNAGEQLRQLNASLEMVVKHRTLQWERASSRLTSLLNHLPFGILAEDENRKVILVNQRFCEIFNLTLKPDQLVGDSWIDHEKNLKSLFREPEKYLERILEIVSQRNRTASEQIFLKDGRVLERNFIPILYQKGYQGHFWQYQDVTEEQNAKNRLIRLKQKSEEQNQEKAKLLQSIGQELKTTLEKLVTDFELKSSTFDNREEFSSLFKEDIQSLLLLTQNIRTYSKLEEGLFSTPTLVFRPSTVIQKILVDFEGFSRSKKIEFKIQIDEKIPSWVFGDSSALDLALRNLCKHSLKLKQGGSLSLSLEAQEVESKFVKIRYAFKRVGAEPAASLHKQPPSPESPSGFIISKFELDLYVAEFLVLLMDGSLAVESPSIQESSFSFTLTHLVDGSLNATSSGEAGREKTYSFLIVDPDIEEGDALLHLLKEAEIDVDQTVSFQNALHKIKHKNYDALFIDFSFLLEDNFQFIREVRLIQSQQERPAPHLIALHSGVSEDEEVYSKVGLDGALRKPIHLKALTELIKSHFSFVPTGWDRMEHLVLPSVESPGFTTVSCSLASDPEISRAIPQYLEKKIVELQQIGQLLEQGEHEQIEKIARQIKESSQAYNLEGLHQLSEKLEHVARVKHEQAVRIILRQLEGYLALALDSVRES